MKIALTSMNEKYLLSICDIETEEITHIPNKFFIDDHRPFGITWNEERMFIAQPTSIITLDKNFKQNIHLMGLWYGIHQILFYDEKLWMVSPRLNAIQFGDKYFFPDECRVGGLEAFAGKDKLNYINEDKNHYNSILIKDNKLYLAAHNHNKPGFVIVFSYPGLNFICKYENLGKQIHNIFVDDEIYVLDSLGSQSIISTGGKRLKIGGGFIRGLAATEEAFIIGSFPYDPKRHKRRNGDSELVIVDRKKWQVFKRILIKDIGNINDIRILDKKDLCHGVHTTWENSDNL